MPLKQRRKLLILITSIILISFLISIRASNYTEITEIEEYLNQQNLPTKISLNNWLAGASYFLATSLGILFKILWDSDDLKSALNFKKMKALLISPIVFGAVYIAVSNLSDPFLALLLAFQNGFFWQSVLLSSEAKLSGSNENI